MGARQIRKLDSTTGLSCSFFVPSSAVQGEKTMAGLRMTALPPGAREFRRWRCSSACDNGPSAVSKQAAGTQMATATRRSGPTAGPRGGYDSAPQVDHRKDAGRQGRRRQAHVGGQPALLRRGGRPAAPSSATARPSTPRRSISSSSKAHAFVGHPPKGTADPDPQERRHPLLRPQGQRLRRGQQGRRAAHHVQAGRRHGLLGEAEGPRGAPATARRSRSADNDAG